MPNHLSRLEKNIKRIIWEQQHGAWQKSFDYARFLGIISAIFTALTTAASLASLIAIACFFGLNHASSSGGWSSTLLNAALALFTLNIILGTVFSFRTYVLRGGILKWCVNTLVLVNAVAVFIPPVTAWYDFIFSHGFLFSSLAAYSVVYLSARALELAGSYRLNPSLILASSFILVIVAGTFLLMLPKSTNNPISLVDAFFISTSAVCVTGLSPVDISQDFTGFGLLVLSFLIQTGGLGLITFTSVFAVFYSGSTSIYNQLLIKDMFYSKSMDALLPTLIYVLGFTLAIEAIGAFLIYFSVDNTLFSSSTDKLIFSLFHAMSAFCNAGFSNLKDGLSNPVLMHGTQWFYLIICGLMFLGSIGFPILINFKDKLLSRIRTRIFNSKDDPGPITFLDLNTKLVLIFSIALVGVSTLLFFVFEYDNTLRGLDFSDKIVQSLFNSILPRTTGFQSLNPCDFKSVTIVLICFLMWIGGSSQSMAGGIKVNTIAVLFFHVKDTILGKRKTEAFCRTIPDETVLRAYAVAFTAVFLVIGFSMILMLLEPTLPTQSLVFEVMSALFTVGSSLSLTPLLSDPSKLVLCFAMFIGRVGLLSILIGLWGQRPKGGYSYPDEKVIIN